MLLGYCLHGIEIFLMYIFKRKFLLNKNIYVNIADFWMYDTKLNIIKIKAFNKMLYLEHVYCLIPVKELTKITQHSPLYSDRESKPLRLVQNLTQFQGFLE